MGKNTEPKPAACRQPIESADDRTMDADVMTHARKMRSPPPVTASGLTFLTRKESARELRISLTKLDCVIARGELRAKKHGHAVVVMRSEIERYIRQWPYVKPPPNAVRSDVIVKFDRSNAPFEPSLFC